jgi:hypothetical protein
MDVSAYCRYFREVFEQLVPGGQGELIMKTSDRDKDDDDDDDDERCVYLFAYA